MTSMDEIICPECGRPNLAEAEKCWYCQVSLVRTEDRDIKTEEPILGNSEIPGTEDNSSRSSIKEEEENLPDWLKRIRELKKADTPVEETDQWQQEKLFSGLPQDKDEIEEHPAPVSRPVKSREEPERKPLVPDEQPPLDEVFPEEPSDDKVESQKIEPEDSEDELPDGFTPLEH